VRLGPFRRTEQSGLFSVPRAIDDGPLRRPALFDELAEAARFFQHCGQATQRIFGAIHPSIVVVAAHDPLIGERRSAQPRDHIVERFLVPVEGQLEVRAPGSGAEAVGDRQAAAPLRRHDGACQGRQERLRVSIRNRQHGNLRQRRRVFDGEAFGVGGRPDAGREGIARIERHVHHAAALGALARPHRPAGEHLTHIEAVVLRV